MHNNYRLCIIIRYGHGTFSNICNGHTKTGILFTFDNKKKYKMSANTVRCVRNCSFTPAFSSWYFVVSSL